MNKIIEFLKNHPCISVNCIEKAAGLPRSTVAHAMEGTRGLNDTHIEKLLPILKKYGYK